MKYLVASLVAAAALAPPAQAQTDPQLRAYFREERILLRDAVNHEYVAKCIPPRRIVIPAQRVSGLRFAFILEIWQARLDEAPALPSRCP